MLVFKLSNGPAIHNLEICCVSGVFVLWLQKEEIHRLIKHHDITHIFLAHHRCLIFPLHVLISMDSSDMIFQMI